MFVVAAPNPALDKLYVVGSLVPGEIHRPKRIVERAGGKGFNVSRAAHALGRRVLTVGLVAGHIGQRLEQMLVSEGLALDAVESSGESRSTLAVVEESTWTMTEFYEQGDEALAAGWSGFSQRVLERCSPGGWLAISGSLPAGVPPDQARDLVLKARSLGAHVAIDHDGPVLTAALSARPSLVKVNRHEARAVTGADPLDAIWQLADQIDGGTVIITLGTEGALLLESGRLWHGSLDVRGRFPTGCGDAFLAGVMTRCCEAGGTWTDAFAWGLGASSANAELPGPGTLDPCRAEVLATRARDRVRRL